MSRYLTFAGRYQQARRQGVAHSAGTDSPQSSERPTGVSPLSAERHAVDPGKYDLSIWHYKPWWCQPPMIVATGLSVIAAAFFLSEESYKVTLLASGPVFAWWYIFLYVMPRQFKSFAIDYMETHDMPEEKKQQ